MNSSYLFSRNRDFGDTVRSLKREVRVLVRSLSQIGIKFVYYGTSQMFTFSYNIWNENQDKKVKSKELVIIYFDLKKKLGLRL